jgi:hypothetical protein
MMGTPVKFGTSPRQRYQGEHGTESPSLPVTIGGHRHRLLHVAGMALLVMPLVAGCQAMYFFTNPDASRPVKAEYRVGKKKLAVIVWADRSVIDEYPSARRMVCRALTHELTTHLEEQGATLVSARKISEFQEHGDANWEAMSNNEIGKELKADMVLRVDLIDFTTRAAETRQLQKARISANVNLYPSGETTANSLYSDEIKTTYPPDSLHGAQDLEEADLLHQAVDYFAAVAARKFYDHEVKLEDDKGS